MAAKHIFLLLVVFLGAETGWFAGADPVCTFGTNDGSLDSKEPLLFAPGTDQFIQPTQGDKFVVGVGSSIDLACTAKFASPLSGSAVTATCVKDDVFAVGTKTLQMKDIVCSAAIARSARETDRICFDNSIVGEIGFVVGSKFIPTIEVCHNIKKSTTYYAHYSMYPGSAYFQTAVSRPSFIKGGFYKNVDVDGMYTQATQQVTFNNILGSASSQYFNIPANLYLARGHLAAKADFILAPPQLATFFYINVAPAWQTFNAGNWGRIEDGIRKFAANRSLSLDVYTGGWGISKLPDSNGVEKELYLGFNSAGEGIIPVPRLFYKVIIDKNTQQGIVLIGVNNPFLTMDYIENSEIICNDVSDNINWLTWDKTNINRGYSYACDVNEFAALVPDLPPLSTTGLLY